MQVKVVCWGTEPVSLLTELVFRINWFTLVLNCSDFSHQPILYEGQDKNPEMCRVLLTHEIMCR